MPTVDAPKKASPMELPTPDARTGTVVVDKQPVSLSNLKIGTSMPKTICQEMLTPPCHPPYSPFRF